METITTKPLTWRQYRPNAYFPIEKFRLGIQGAKFSGKTHTRQEIKEGRSLELINEVSSFSANSKLCGD